MFLQVAKRKWIHCFLSSRSKQQKSLIGNHAITPPTWMIPINYCSGKKAQVKNNHNHFLAGKNLTTFNNETFLNHFVPQKSVILQYNMLVSWDDGTNELSTKLLMFQALLLFHKILQNLLQKPFQFILFFYKITYMKKKSFEYSKSNKKL